MIFVAMELFPTAQALCDSIRLALDGIDPPAPAEENLHPIPKLGVDAERSGPLGFPRGRADALEFWSICGRGSIQTIHDNAFERYAGWL